jgi:hypothetical protein
MAEQQTSNWLFGRIEDGNAFIDPSCPKNLLSFCLSLDNNSEGNPLSFTKVPILFVSQLLSPSPQPSNN